MGGTLTPGAWTRLLALAAGARSVRPRRGEGGRYPPTPSQTKVRTETDSDLATLYLDLIAAIGRGPLVLAQVGQSLDGRIATESGHSRYINGGESLDHLHRLRALADAVVVGATTVALDNPRLTTRRVEGPSPTRVILDPHGRLAASANVFDGSAPTLLITDAALTPPGEALEHPASARGIPVLPLPAADGRFQPAAILARLRQRGLPPSSSKEERTPSPLSSSATALIGCMSPSRRC